LAGYVNEFPGDKLYTFSKTYGLIFTNDQSKAFYSIPNAGVTTTIPMNTWINNFLTTFLASPNTELVPWSVTLKRTVVQDEQVEAMMN
jgi:hypothetical protein